MLKRELIEAIDLLERVRQLGELWFDETTADPVLNMVLFVLKRHLTGQLVTPTSLAQAAGIPYTTATRRIASMHERGLLDLRPRTASGRSFSVHPSPKLISSGVSYLVAVRTAIGETSVPKRSRRRSQTPTEGPSVIPPPSVARKALGFGTGLTILAPDDPAYSIGRRLRRELAYLMGGNVSFPEASIDDLRTRVLANAEKAVSAYDVVAVDLPLIAEFASRGVLARLDDIAAEGAVIRADFHSAAWRGTISDEKQYAIPILINPQLLFYRQDLFQGLGCGAPETTGQLLDAAARLHNPADGFYGASWTAARGGPTGQAFIQFLADFGQPVFQLERTVDGYKTSRFDQQSLRPSIDTPRGHATAKFMLDLLELSPPDVLNLGWGGQIDLLREGRVAMAYEWASRAAQLAGSDAVRELDFLPHPVGEFSQDTRKRQNIAPIGGFAFGIPANIEPGRIQTAWSAIEWLSSPEIIKLLVQHGGYVTPRISVSEDPDVRQLSPMITAVDRMARSGEIRLWPRPPVAAYSSVVTILGEEIHDMLSGKQSSGDALKRAQQRAEALH